MTVPLTSRSSAGLARVLSGVLTVAFSAAALVSTAPAASAADPLKHPIASPDDLVQSWYVSVLGRGPANAADDISRDTWVDRIAAGTSSTDVVTELASSEEYARDHVEATYRDVLHRRTDPGAGYWITQVRSGALTLADVDRAVLSSPEMVNRWSADRVGRDRYVQDLYAAVLGRYTWETTPGERAWWVGRIASVGAPQAVAEMWATPEAADHRIDHVYRLMLRRPADSRGLGYWRGVEARSGLVAVVAGIGASGEYRMVDWKAPYELDTSTGPYPFPYHPRNEQDPRRDTPPPPPGSEPSTSPSPTPGG